MEDMILFYDLVLRKFFSFKSVVFYFLVKLFFIYLKIYLIGKAIYYCFFFLTLEAGGEKNSMVKPYI